MATYDNKIWLLKTIRDAFIATDDTGLCEIVMAGEDFSKIFQNKSVEEKRRLRDGRLNQPGPSTGRDGMGDISEEEIDKEIVTRFDPYPDMDDSEDDDDPLCDSYVRNDPGFGGRYDRNRTNAGQWLDKKDLALKKAAKIKIIKWEDSSPLTKEQLEEVFSKCEITKLEKQSSLLTQQLQNCPNLPHRQYLEYAKFDGTAQLGLPVKSFKIFMTMLPEKHQNYPLVVCVIAGAKIKDLIGFTCYKYSIEHPDISLGSVHDYGLCIAEDDGEVDWAFPCLDANEPCSKFGFTCLGLIELKNKNVLCPTPMPMDISGAFNMFPKTENSGQSHHGGSRLYTGDSSTSEAVLNAIKALNEGAGDTDVNKIQSHIMATEAPQYKAYKVQLLRKVRTNTSVQLGISLDRIEVEPLVTNKHAFWSRSKYFLYSIDSVAWCQVLETRGNRTTFRIVYSPSHNAANYDRSSTERARLLAVGEWESGLWIQALPSPNIGTMLDDTTFRIATCLRLGTPCVSPHHCTCGVAVDNLGHHGGREPNGLARSDGKRLDGMSLLPWKMGRRLVWDATCVDTLEPSHLLSTSRCTGAAAASAEGLKRRKYANLAGQNSYIFLPNTSYKIQDFECDHEIAKEIVDKVNTILDLRNSPCRRDYKTAKEKKLQTRKSFHTKQLS